MRACHARPFYALRAGHPPNCLTAVLGGGVARPGRAGGLRKSSSPLGLCMRVSQGLLSVPHQRRTDRDNQWGRRWQQGCPSYGAQRARAWRDRVTLYLVHGHPLSYAFGSPINLFWQKRGLKILVVGCCCCLHNFFHSKRQAHTGRGIHGLPKVSCGPAMPNPYIRPAGGRPATVFFPLGYPWQKGIDFG
jgi:diadenosine tetraphosphatase ApaH/serine/threonine PP2A family protein phosphatase